MSHINDSVEYFNMIKISNASYVPINLNEKFSNLRMVTVKRCPLRKITRNNFKLNKLETLELSFDHINVIEENSFDELKELRLIEIDFNRLTKLSENLFSRTVSLEEIHLNHNSITSLPSKLFRNLAKLKWLSVTSNNLTFLHSEIFRNNKNLKKLFLQNNHLTEIVDTFYTPILENLFYLNLKNNTCIDQCYSDDEKVLNRTNCVRSYHLKKDLEKCRGKYFVESNKIRINP